LEWTNDRLLNMGTDVTKKMLKTIREGVEKARKDAATVKPLVVEESNVEKDNFLTRSKILMEEAERKNQKKNLIEDKNINDDKHNKSFPITKKTPQFGDVRVSQEESILKTVGEQVKFNDDSLLYYPDADDLVLNGEIPSMNTAFQFRFNDPSSEGIYVWSEGLQLTDSNSRTLGKIRDAFLNWKQGLVQDGDLMDKLKKVSERNK
jgi:hypothetical protein